MSDVESQRESQPYGHPRVSVPGALALSSPALLSAALLVYSPWGDDIPLWFGFAFALALCLVTGIAYVGVAQLYPATVPGGFNSLGEFLSEAKDSRFARVCGSVAGTAAGICCWVFPVFWLSMTAAAATLLIQQIWPTNFTFQNPLVNLLPAAVLVAVLYFGRGRSKAIVVGVSLAVAVIQIAAILAASVLILRQPHLPIAKTKSDAAWTLDSSGNPTQYVQDMALDQSRTQVDPKDPTHEIQDPTAFTPKIDPRGNPIWVYVAVDAKGRVMKDGAGQLLVVPTDARGNLERLPAGAVRADPEENTITLPADASSFQSHTQPTSQPIEQSYVMMAGCIDMIVLAGFLFLALLGQRARGTRLVLNALIFTLLVQGSAYFALRSHLSEVEHLLYGPLSASPASTPVGDMVQHAGAWAFGSPRAGWWSFMAENSILMLVLFAATALCFDVGQTVSANLDDAPATRVTRTRGSKKRPRGRDLVRAGIALVLCAINLTQIALRSPEAPFSLGVPVVGNGSIADFGIRAALATPSLMVVIEASSTWAVVALFMLISLALAHAMYAKPERRRIGNWLIASIGMLLGLACLVFLGPGPLFLARFSGKEPLCALLLCVCFVIGGAIRRRRPTRRHGHCPVCGYDLRATSGRCPECGIESEERVRS